MVWRKTSETFRSGNVRPRSELGAKLSKGDFGARRAAPARCSSEIRVPPSNVRAAGLLLGAAAHWGQRFWLAHFFCFVLHFSFHRAIFRQDPNTKRQQIVQLSVVVPFQSNHGSQQTSNVSKQRRNMVESTTKTLVWWVTTWSSIVPRNVQDALVLKKLMKKRHRHPNNKHSNRKIINWVEFSEQSSETYRSKATRVLHFPRARLQCPTQGTNYISGSRV